MIEPMEAIDYKALVEENTHILWQMDEKGVLVYVSPNIEKFLGFPRERVIGRDIPPFIPPERQKAYRSFLHSLTKHFPRPFHLTTDMAHHADGTPLLTEVSGLPFFGPEGLRGYRGTGRILSIRREYQTFDSSQEAAIRSDILFKTVVNTLPIRIFWKDHRFRYLGANRLFLEDIGIPSEEKLIGKDDYTLLKSETADVCRRGDLKVMHTGQGLFAKEEKVYRADGREIIVSMYKVPLKNAKGEITGIVGAYVDITRLKESERMLQESRFRLKEAQDLAKLGCWDLDLRNEEMEWSEEMMRMFGYPPRKSITGFDLFLEHLSPTDRTRLKERIAEAIQKKESFLETTCEFIRKRGERGWLHLRAQIVYDYEEAAFWIKGTVQDISQTVELRRKVEEKRALLDHQNRLLQMGRLLENIAHQWKQPLAQINVLLLEMEMAFEQDGFDQKSFTAFFERIENLTHYMGETIENFQKYLSPKTALEVFDPRETVEKALAILQDPLQKKRILVETEWQESISIVGSSKDLLHVLLVILNNAIDVLTARNTCHPKITLRFTQRTKEENCECFLEIADNGGGIDPKIAEHIFDPYFTTKFDSKGRGVGLYMARMIVENRMQGTLELIDMKTSTFLLTFRGIR